MVEAFYRENYATVYGYLLSLCGDPALAEEVTAETFLRAVEKIEQYDARFKPSTWLCTIGRNLLRSRYKKNNPFTALTEDLEPVAPSPEALYLQKETLEEIWAILQRFDRERRQLFIMHLEGMPFARIAAAMGKTESWARVTYFRMKDRILREMEGKR